MGAIFLYADWYVLTAIEYFFRVINGFLMKNDICVISRLYIGERHTIATHDNKKPIVIKYRKTKHVARE
jgi:hypothetical protein